MDNEIILNIIVLAGGNSKRFGENKLLYKIDGLYMYQITLNKIIKEFNNIENVVITVVTQYDEIYYEIINGDYPNFVNCVLDKICSDGISNTIKIGIKAFENSRWFMFCVCDQPYINSTVYLKLFKNTIKSNKNIGSVRFNDISGNPVIFNKKYKYELISLKGDVGGRYIVKKYKNDTYFFNVSSIEELNDIDYKKDIQDDKK